VEQAGGAATDGRTRILDLQPKGLHQRVAVVLGSKNEVERVASDHGCRYRGFLPFIHLAFPGRKIPPAGKGETRLKAPNEGSDLSGKGKGRSEERRVGKECRSR